MKLRYKLILIMISILLSFLSCNKLSPAGFWKNYHTEFKQTEKSDQGPRGGYTEIVWNNDKINILDKEDILNYASHNGWKLTDRLAYINDVLSLQTNYNINDYSYAILQEKVLPLLNPNETYKIFVFTTGWIAVEPGNARETEKNGFVVLNSDKNNLLIYHLWGE